MSHGKPIPGAAVPQMNLPRTGAEGTIAIGGEQDRWTMLFVYRGTHCPRCKRFLNKLDANLAAWQEHLRVVVVSADTEEKALADKKEHGWTFDLCHGLTIPQMRDLGLYVSEPLSTAEASAPFAEPGAFGIRPDGSLMLLDISNGPAARPDLAELLDGMIFNIANDRPTRGTA